MPRPVDNPPNPWASTHVEHLGEPPPARLEVFEEEARSILSKNDSPDIPFTYSVNPYRGCLHACAYCYARPSHQYLGFGAGTDFDRKIVVKTNAPALLREALGRPSWTGEETIVFSGSTDCYQALEATYGLTRRCLEVCLEFRQPVAVITKSALVARDADLLGRLSREAASSVTLSIPILDDEIARAIEPFASKPSRRLEALRRLSDAGVETGVSLAPVIPGLTESHIPEILARAREAGASRAFMVLLRLPREVLPIFDARLEEALPLRAGKVRRAIQEARGGRMNESAFGARMRGAGARWQAVEALFDLHCRRLGLNVEGVPSAPRKTFRRPERQGKLFDL